MPHSFSFCPAAVYCIVPRTGTRKHACNTRRGILKCRKDAFSRASRRYVGLPPFALTYCSTTTTTTNVVGVLGRRGRKTSIRIHDLAGGLRLPDDVTLRRPTPRNRNIFRKYTNIDVGRLLSLFLILACKFTSRLRSVIYPLLRDNNFIYIYDSYRAAAFSKLYIVEYCQSRENFMIYVFLFYPRFVKASSICLVHWSRQNAIFTRDLQNVVII